MAKKVLFQIAIEENNGESKLHIFIEKAVPPPVMCNHLAKAIQMVCGSTIMDNVDSTRNKPNIWTPDKGLKIQ